MSAENPEEPVSRRYKGPVGLPDSLPSPAASRPHPLRATGGTRRSGDSRLASLVYGGIKDALLEGEHEAAERLSVDQIARAHGVSKQPVMSALRRLSIDGLVEIIPQVGVEVARYAQEEIDDFFELFASVESTVARLAGQSNRQDLWMKIF